MNEINIHSCLPCHQRSISVTLLVPSPFHHHSFSFKFGLVWQTTSKYPAIPSHQKGEIIVITEAASGIGYVPPLLLRGITNPGISVQSTVRLHGRGYRWDHRGNEVDSCSFILAISHIQYIQFRLSCWIPLLTECKSKRNMQCRKNDKERKHKP